MKQDDLDKLTRVSETLHNISSVITGLERNKLFAYKEAYKRYYELIHPIALRYLEYRLEFFAVTKPDGASANDMILAFISLKSFVDSVIKQETLKSKTSLDSLKNEIFIDENKPFAVHKVVSDITGRAVSSLKIVDNYIESTSLDFFHNVNTKVEIKILSMEAKPNSAAFKIALKKFLKEWGGSQFELKVTKYFHDRYILIDNSEVWHLGPSLNRLGIKPAMISQIQDAEIIRRIIELFDQQWISAFAI